METEESSGMQTPEDAVHAPPAISYLCPIGYRNSVDCGYCRRRRAGPSQKRFSYYATATDLTPEFYKSLIDRCWRRSGTLLYRPNQNNACCPHYTLRLDAAGFKATKDQRQTINRFNKHVLGESYVAKAARSHPRSREESKRRDTVFDLVERVHEAESERLPHPPPEPAHRFTVTLEPDTFTEEKYAVFENYQRIVHGEPPSKISRRGFTRFLCNSPIRRETAPATTPGGKGQLLGSYHQCYRLDGALVAIGVLDLLPDCVSAVYFLYHESIHAHNPGKLGALREIALALEGGYRWWYSGYYIHTCPKMRYKMDYTPQNILDPNTQAWHQLDKSNMSIFDSHGLAHFLAEQHGQAQGEQGGGGGSGGRGTGLANGTAGGGEGEGRTNGDGLDPEQKEVNMIDGNVDEKIEDDDNDDGGDEDDEEEFLLKSNMPGILSMEQVSKLDLDDLRLVIDGYSNPLGAPSLRTSDLVVWQSQNIASYPCLKSTIAELVAALGADLLDRICIDFRDHHRG